jgi:hypothetical protein
LGRFRWLVVEVRTAILSDTGIMGV